jgi:hypothetical protein
VRSRWFLAHCEVESTLYWYDPDGLDRGQCMCWRLLPEFNFFGESSKKEEGEGGALLQKVRCRCPST